MKNTTRSASAVVVSLAFLLATAPPLAAQITPANDPANLAGERVSPQDLADTLPINHGAPALQQLLRKLRTRASFMLIVAHPDDEDDGGLTYLSRGQGARVATLTLNRGEGGQNLMSADFGEALGLIRTQELLACDRYMDVDQFFGTEIDFGFSKTKEESFAKWGHDRVLYDAVRAIRLYRPLVIASVFIGAPSDGHGQHQVSGEIAQEAFKAAGDPNVFPDQIAASLLPWQPLKVYARSPFARIDSQGMYDYATSQYVPPRFTNYVTGKVTETVPKVNVIVPEGDTDPLLGGESYAQFGREGRNLQRSQIGGGGGGRGGPGGRADVGYHRYGSRLNQPDGDDSALESSFFDGIDTTLPGISSLAPEVADKFHPLLTKIDQQIAEAQRLFDPAKPELTGPPLREALKGVDGFIHELENPGVNDLPATETFNLLHELRIKRVQLNNALVLALGISVNAHLLGPNQSDLVLTSEPSISAEMEASVTGSQPAQIRKFTFITPNETLPGNVGVPPSATAITQGATYSLSHPLKSGLSPTRPYFSRPDIEQPFYDISNPNLRNAPATPAPLMVHVEFDSGGVPIFVDASLAKHPDGQVAQPVLLVPPISLSVSPYLGILTPKQQMVAVSARVRTQSPTALSGTVTLKLPDGKAIASEHPNFTLAKPGEAAAVDFTVAVSGISNQSHTLTAVAREDGHTYSEGYRPVGYHGLTTTNYYTPATFKAVAIDVHTAPNLNVAYLPGTGDDVPSALEDLGIHPHILTTADLTPETLKPYDAIILGVRAYTAHPELTGAGSQPLLNYARSGGVVIAQFNNGRYGDAEAPFPITVASSSGDHAHDVIDETAPVTILTPDSPLLTWPNRITTADFDNWVEERGHAFAGTWASQYQPLLESHDPGQQPQKGGLLIAHVGKGSYIYLGLALYRQLPEGVPGAYRLLANLISAAKNPRLQTLPTR